MTRILAIDPGSSQSAWLVYEDGRPVQPSFGILANDELVRWLRRGAPVGRSLAELRCPAVVVIEWTAPRGMPASAELFETLWWAGRFGEAASQSGIQIERLRRLDIKRHLCGTTAAKDGNVRAALVDRFGGSGGKAAAVGLKASPGPLYGVANDVWQALAVAVTWADQAEDPR